VKLIVIAFYSTDSSGEFLRVDYSQQQRDAHFSVPLDQVIPWYEAHAAFTEEIYNPENTVYFKLKEGTSLNYKYQHMSKYCELMRIKLIQI
jgi:hypothetical protein